MGAPDIAKTVYNCLRSDEKMRPMMTVRRSSVFPASADEIFRRLQRLDTLQYIAAPLATFSPTGETPPDGELRWEAGKTFAFRLRLFGVIPLGDHVIRVLEFGDRPYAIFTRESNPSVPTWNHRIELSALDADRTRYTDDVEIGAGWKTPLIWLWAWFFYGHRQRKWIRILTRER